MRAHLGFERRSCLRFEHFEEVADDVLGLLSEKHTIIRCALDQVVGGVLTLNSQEGKNWQ
jgi:hypothetical protein